MHASVRTGDCIECCSAYSQVHSAVVTAKAPFRYKKKSEDSGNKWNVSDLSEIREAKKEVEMSVTDLHWKNSQKVGC